VVIGSPFSLPAPQGRGLHPLFGSGGLAGACTGHMACLAPSIRVAWVTLMGYQLFLA